MKHKRFKRPPGPKVFPTKKIIDNHLKLCPQCKRQAYIYDNVPYSKCDCGFKIFNDTNYYISQKGEIKSIETQR